MRHVWDRARHNLGFANDEHFVPYICRHTCASRLAQRGVPINVVNEWMGHKSITMTMRYAHLAPSTLKTAAGVLEEARPSNSGRFGHLHGVRPPRQVVVQR